MDDHYQILLANVNGAGKLPVTPPKATCGQLAVLTDVVCPSAEARRIAKTTSCPAYGYWECNVLGTCVRACIRACVSVCRHARVRVLVNYGVVST